MVLVLEDEAFDFADALAGFDAVLGLVDGLDYSLPCEPKSYLEKDITHIFLGEWNVILRLRGITIKLFFFR
jgi:hypothetical protein